MIAITAILAGPDIRFGQSEALSSLHGRTFGLPKRQRDYDSNFN